MIQGFAFSFGEGVIVAILIIVLLAVLKGR
jgi:hypothetical protein